MTVSFCWSISIICLMICSTRFALAFLASKSSSRGGAGTSTGAASSPVVSTTKIAVDPAGSSFLESCRSAAEISSAFLSSGFNTSTCSFAVTMPSGEGVSAPASASVSLSSGVFFSSSSSSFFFASFSFFSLSFVSLATSLTLTASASTLSISASLSSISNTLFSPSTRQALCMEIRSTFSSSILPIGSLAPFVLASSCRNFSLFRATVLSACLTRSLSLPCSIRSYPSRSRSEGGSRTNSSCAQRSTCRGFGPRSALVFTKRS
mmetsp:Transcript_1838/g.3934  ORF Transcript_1838/g.3934 Transcript_1838/m.3934 type:complete len:264 (+) Transcript_1838:739-1530(+)